MSAASQGPRLCIIGATSAIAQATARCFAADRATFFLVGRRQSHLEAVAADLVARGAVHVTIHVCEVNRVETHAALLDAAWQALGEIDCVCIAHGMMPPQSVCDHDVAVTLEVFQTNAVSTIALLVPLAERMIAQGRGTIAVITSVAGDRGRRANYAYGAAKGAVSLFLQGLRSRLHRHGVQVCTIKPGPVRTPMTAALRRDFLFVEPAVIGAGIYRAIRARRDVVYLPWYWRGIMAVLKHLPEAVTKRLGF